jgi:penicillin-binding protein 2
LCFPEALERSCNVYFETVADRLGLDGLSRWYLTFGIGRPTGIGIPEVLGRLPDSLPQSVPQWVTKNTTWFCGIGQGYVAATPLQMCNVAATIARDGVWMRPRLVPDDEQQQLRTALHLDLSADGRQTIDVGRLGDPNVASAASNMSEQDVPDRIDLGLSKEALAAARLGMDRVVNSPGGTGTTLRADDPPYADLFKHLVVAGKTGTAQAASLRPAVRDPATGKYELDEKGHVKRVEVEPSTLWKSNPHAPWYFAFNAAYSNERRQQHSWFIGFAPAEHPRIAFAVLVEYGGSGGGAAGCVARELLAACVDHGYVPLSSPDDVKRQRDEVSGFTVGGDLLHDINSIAVAPSALAEPAAEASPEAASPANH